MKIKCSNKGVRWIYNRGISEEKIFFDEKGYVTVSMEVGNLLIERYPDIDLVKSTKSKSKEE